MDIEDLGDDVDRPISARGPTVRELATGERARDWALEMSYAYRPELFKRLGWHPKGQSKFRQAIRSIAANLVMAKKLSSTGQVSISRSKKLYGYKKRWRNTLHTYDLVVGAVGWMEANGLLIEHRASGYAPNDRRATGLQTTIEATPKLLKALSHVPLQRADDFDSIRMRDANGVRIRFDETEQTAAMRTRMARVNAMISGIRIVMPPCCKEIAPGFWKCPARTKGQYAYVHLDDAMRAYRMFNRESWQANGRLYGVWQSIPKKVRKQIRFRDAEGIEVDVVELDYESNHAYMLHARRGHILTHKPYDVVTASYGRFSRDNGKITLLAMTNALHHRDAVGAVKIRFDKEGMTFPDAGLLVEMIRELNPIISDDFFSDAGVGLMHDDSEIALAVIEDLMDKGIAVLPVHDSFLVAKQHESALQTAMDRAMADYVKKVWPKGAEAEAPSLQVPEQMTVDAFQNAGACQDAGIPSVNTPQVIPSLPSSPALSPVVPEIVATTKEQWFSLIDRRDVSVDYLPSRPTASERRFFAQYGWYPCPDWKDPSAGLKPVKSRLSHRAIAEVLGDDAADDLFPMLRQEMYDTRRAEWNRVSGPLAREVQKPRRPTLKPVAALIQPEDDPLLKIVMAAFPGAVIGRFEMERAAA